MIIMAFNIAFIGQLVNMPSDKHQLQKYVEPIPKLLTHMPD